MVTMNLLSRPGPRVAFILVITALLAGAGWTAFNASASIVRAEGEDATSPSMETIASFSECANPEIAGEVFIALSNTTESPANGLLVTPGEVRDTGGNANEVAAQRQAWDSLSARERDFQLCLRAYQDSIGR